MTEVRTSGGHVLSNEQWLDTHAAACAAEYREFVRRAGLSPGWTVLDLGSGSGSFIPWLLEAVGPHGRLLCGDLAWENCRLCASKLGAAGGVAMASLGAAPFRPGSLDAVWCANASQFLTDEQFTEALIDLRRIIRPGGFLAIKDLDMTAFKISPASPFLGSHLAEACLKAPDAPPESAGSLRGRDLRRWLEQAGFENVRQESFFIERWAPLSPAESELWSEWLCYLAGLAVKRGVPDEDLGEWNQIAREGGRRFVAQPDFYGCEVQVLAVGTVAGEATP